MSVEVVAQAKADLLAIGENLDGPCGAHKITAEAAWRLRSTGVGLVFSTGNGCTVNGIHYRGDSVMYADGHTIDCLLYAENKEGQVYPEVGHDEYNIPAWNDVETNQTPDKWRAPYDPGFFEDDSGTTPQPTPPVDTQAILDAIADSEARIVEEVKAQGDRITEKQDYYADQVEHAALQILAAWLILRGREDEDGITVAALAQLAADRLEEETAE